MITINTGKSVYITFMAVLAVVMFLPIVAFAGLLPDTGQTKCYNNTQEIPCPQPGQDFYGQDAQYGPNLHSYTDLGNGVVRDNVTGLEWQQATAPGTYTWQQAIDYCNNLSLGGKDNWRLPTVKELSTLVDSSMFPRMRIDTNYFQTNYIQWSGLSLYWSSSANPALNPNDAWLVRFDYGYVHSDSPTKGYLVRAVRGDTTSNNFIDNGDGTVTDTSTGLMWEQNGVTVSSWAGALSYCENLTLGGHSDWRLPNRNELQTLVDYGRVVPSIDTAYFPNTNVSYYWSSTSDAGMPDFAWYVDFGYGYVYPWDKSLSESVRAVRGWQGGGLGDLPLFVQPFSQNDPAWACDTLGHCSTTDILGVCKDDERDPSGCAVSSLAMAVNYFNPCTTDPGKLNECLTLESITQTGLYAVNDCNMLWGNAKNSSCLSDMTLEISNPISDTACINEIIESLDNGWPVIVRVYNAAVPSHFIVMYSHEGTSLQFMDPWDGQAHTWPQGAAELGEYNFYSNHEIIICQGNPSTTGSRCDGLPRTELFGPEGTDPDYDGNGDTLPDWQQSNVSSFHSYDRQSYVTLEAPPETTLGNVQAVDNPSLADVPLYIDFQQQFFSFTINNVTGGLAIVTLHLPVGTSINTYYKYGPTPDNPMLHWYKFMYDGATGTGALINNNIITLYFIDGRRGDDDLTPNGTIIDVGGPGIEGDATVVTLSSFNATPKDGKIVLEWKTESEIDNAGFNVYRSEAKDGKYSKINTALISAKGSATQGAAYEYTDTNVRNRKTYWYKLEDIDLSGKSTLNGPVSATPRLIFGVRD